MQSIYSFKKSNKKVQLGYPNYEISVETDDLDLLDVLNISINTILKAYNEGKCAKVIVTDNSEC